MSLAQWTLQSTLRDGTTREVNLHTLARRLGLDPRDFQPAETWSVQAVIDKLAAAIEEVEQITAYWNGNALLTTARKETK